MKKIAIIGAGIGGLAAAHTLKKFKDKGEDVQLSLIEAGARAGGKMMSERKDGFLCEYGPNAILDNRPSAMTLCAELGLKERLLRSNDAARKRYIYSKGRLHRLPEGPVSFLTSRLLSVTGKVRIMAEYWTKKGDGTKDETIEEFAKRRLGKEAYEMLLDPMIMGIFAGDPTKMSLRTCFPRIYELEMTYGGLIKAMLKLAKERKKTGEKSGGPSGPAGALVSFENGLQELIDALSEELKRFIELNSKVTSLIKKEGGYLLTIEKGGQKEEKLFDKVIVCTPAYVMPYLFADLNAKIASELKKIPYAPVAVAALGFNKADISHKLDGFGFLAPFKEKLNILGCLWTSSIFAYRATEGKALLRIMIGGMRRADLVKKSGDELIKLALNELKKTMGISAAPVFSSIYKHEKAIIQFNAGHEKIAENVKNELKKLPGIYLGCNTFGGIGIDGAVSNSIKAAKEALS